MWRCSSCSQKVEARKGLRLDTVPKILTIQLKRFIFDFQRVCGSGTVTQLNSRRPILKGGRVKINHRVAFPEILHMAPFVEAAAGMVRPSHLRSYTKPSGGPGLDYQLFAILMHSGTAMGGHYYAYIMNLDGVRSSCR